MKNRLFLPLLVALLILVGALVALRRSEQERVRNATNIAALTAENQSLRSRLTQTAGSLPRKRLTVGELQDYRPLLATEIAQLGIALRRVESLTHLTAEQHLDTLLLAPEPLLSDSLCRLRWQDSWVSLAVDAERGRTHIALTTTDTLLQVVHRVPYRWWIFSFGTKAIRQQITSSNPHTRLVYAEYIEIE